MQFTNIFNKQVTSAYYHANMAVDIRLLGNDFMFKIWYSNNNLKLSEYSIQMDHLGAKNIETNTYLFEHQDIDSDPTNSNNLCLIY